MRSNHLGAPTSFCFALFNWINWLKSCSDTHYFDVWQFSITTIDDYEYALKNMRDWCTFLSHFVPSPQEIQTFAETLMCFCIEALCEVGLIVSRSITSIWKSLSEHYCESMLEKYLHLFVTSTKSYSTTGLWAAWNFDLMWSSHSCFLNVQLENGPVNKSHSLAFGEN